MFRLTAVLVAALYATMVIWGEPVADDAAVSRDRTMSTALPGLAATADPVESRQDRSDAAEITQQEAVQMALAAGEKRAQEPEPAAAVREEPEEADERWYVTGSRVNLRSGPSTNDAIIGGVSEGDRAEVLSDPGESWIRIRTEQGLEAWIYGRFLSETPA